MLSASEIAALRRGLFWFTGGVLFCLIAQLLITPRTDQPGLYVYTHPSGARVTVSSYRSATGQAGFRQVDLGRTPGPLQDGLWSSQPLTLSQRGYEPQVVRLRRDDFMEGRYPPTGAIALEPKIPLLAPLAYALRDYPFLFLSALLTLAFLLFKIRPIVLRIRQERSCLERFRQGRFEAGTVLGDYRLDSLLGVGGMARVYRATRPEDPDGEILAFKLMAARLQGDAEARARFRREIQISRRLSHPHIVHLYDWGEVAGHYYLVTELVDGRPLAAHLEEAVPPLGQTVIWVRQVAEALKYAHQHGIVHRDIKPSNVMIRADGRAVVMDFGIATQREMAQLTQAGDILGTPGYMAPEQIETQQADWRSDLYSLGALLFHCLAGRRPFEGNTALSVIAAQLEGEMPPLERRDAPPALVELTYRLLSREPAGRAEDPNQVLEELNRLERELT